MPESKFNCPVCKSPISESTYNKIVRLEEEKLKLDEQRKKEITALKIERAKLSKEKEDLKKKYDRELQTAVAKAKQEAKKAKPILGGVLKPSDLAPTDRLLSEIYKFEKISVREIIQIPFLDTLIEDEYPDIARIVKEKNPILVSEIEKKLEIQPLKLTDITKLSSEDLSKLLKKNGLNNSAKLAEIILNKAGIVNKYFSENQRE